MKTRWLVPTALFLACVIPVLAGVFRSSTILLEWDWVPKFDPTHVDRLPLFLHVLCAGIYYPLCALQVLPNFRARHPLWHRRAGKVAVLTGLIAASSSIWLSAMHLEISGPILRYGRLLFGPLWALFLILGLLAIRRKDFKSHGAWFVRAFAVAMPAGTLIFMVAPFLLVFDELPPVLDESIQSFAWILHLGIAEVLIRRSRRSTTKLSPRSPNASGHASTHYPLVTAITPPSGSWRVADK